MRGPGVSFSVSSSGGFAVLASSNEDANICCTFGFSDKRVFMSGYADGLTARCELTKPRNASNCPLFSMHSPGESHSYKELIETKRPATKSMPR